MKPHILILMMMLAHNVFGQPYFNKRIDLDNDDDFSTNVYITASEILLIGTKQPNPYRQAVVTLRINDTGLVQLIDTVSSDSGTFYASGYNGGTAINESFYLTPLNKLKMQPTYRSSAGFAKLNAMGDTVFTKRLKDTATEFSYIWISQTAENGNLLFGGFVHLNNESYSDNSALLIKTDSLGQTIWEKRFKHPGRFSDVTSINAVNGQYFFTMTDWAVRYCPSCYPVKYYYFPNTWLVQLDTAGNMLSEINDVYGDTTLNIIKHDPMGGFIGFGYIDSIYRNDSEDYQSGPATLFHYNASLAKDWRYSLIDSILAIHPVLIHTTADSGFILLGYTVYNTIQGWAIKFDKQRNKVWEHYYYADSVDDCQLFDVKEKPNGDLVFCGFTRGFGKPTGTDIWVLATDNMGCPSGDCLWPSAVNEPQWENEKESLWLYPNPGRERFSFDSRQKGIGQMISIDGKRSLIFDVQSGRNVIEVPVNFSAGVYAIQVRYDNGAVARVKWVRE